MAVRRLAEKQPESFAFTPENAAWAKAQLAKYPPGREASAVVPLLWRAQAQNDNWLTKPAIEYVADMLGMPYIRALEIATFYSMFNLEPVGKYFVQLCGTTPCMLRGAGELRNICERRIGGERHVSADGLFTWAEVECLGACCNAPMVQINDDYYEDLTPEIFNRLLDDLAAGRPVKKGSQIGRVTSEPEPGKATTLTDPQLYDGSLVGAWRQRFEDEAAKAAAKAESERKAKAEAAKVAPVGSPPESEKAAEPPAVKTPSSGPAPNTAAKTAPPEPRPASPSEGLDREAAAKLASLPPTASAEEKANAVGRRPAGLTEPRAGKADNLQRIRGIGKINEGKLNALGIYHYDQIAAWGAAEIRWVNVYLSALGRIERDDWVGQARKLANGSAAG